MSGKRYRLKATKTKLYDLAKRYHEIPVKLKETEFTKGSRRRDYSLDYFQSGRSHHFLLAVIGGRPMLVYKISELDELGDRHTEWSTNDLNLGTLQEMGMVEKVPERKTERKMSNVG